MICPPASKAQEVGLGLRAQAGEAWLREVVTQGGLTRFRRAAETPFNLILEAQLLSNRVPILDKFSAMATSPS